MTSDTWESLTDRFAAHYDSVRGLVRTRVLQQHLAWHLPPPPAAVVDVGGGAGHQALPLARVGYEVAIVDPSAAMLSCAREALAKEPNDVAERVRLVQGTGEAAVEALGGQRFAGVLCHAVLMYLDDPAPMIRVLCALAAPGAVLSIMTKNERTLAVRPALEGRWHEALAAFGEQRQVNGLGLETRGDSVEHLSELLVTGGAEPLAWYGVRLFTDGWFRDDLKPDDEEAAFAVEIEASRRDPYRQLSRLFHLLGVKR